MWWRKLRGRDTELNEGGKTYYNEKVKNFVDEIDLSMEDEDVKNERSFVNGLDYPFYEHPLVIKDLRKVDYIYIYIYNDRSIVGWVEQVLNWQLDKCQFLYVREKCLDFLGT